jgi:hypothetical protein
MNRLWFNMSMLALESQRAIWLRLLKLSAGGPKARREAKRMVSEKVVAAGRATTRLAKGGSANSVVSGYRRKVRANVRRLSK